MVAHYSQDFHSYIHYIFRSAHYVEVLTSRLGVKAPALSPEQVDMSSTRWASNFVCATFDLLWLYMYFKGK